MAFVQFSDVSLAFGARDILRNATIYLAAGSRAALAGPNGAGKSTLMKILAGQLSPDSGDRAVTRGARVSYLPQTGAYESALQAEATVFDEAEKAYGFVSGLLERQEEIGRLLESSTTDDGATARLIEEHAAIHDAVEGSGYYRRRERIREILQGLGFREGDLDRPLREFSGGWQMRVALAKVLLENPDIMLLDEPTNYLDLEARNWLEDFLGKYSGGVLLVSHDRYFLDATMREVYELFNGKLTRYAGSYTAYEKRRAEELAATLEAWERQQEEIAHLEDFIRRFRYQATKASLVQSRVKQLEKIVPIEIPEGMKKIHFSFPPAPRSATAVVRFEGLGKAYGSHRVLSDLNLEIERGMKVAFVGPNGAGKSTLMRIIAEADREYEGSFRLGSGVIPAYFAQDTAESMGSDPESAGKTVEETAEALCPFELQPKLRNLLGAFLFRGDDVEKPIRVLSGGERSRLALLTMLLRPSNLLILDEPTNHLDLNSKDVLLEALKAYQGTVLFVSHDRGFIEDLATNVLELAEGRPARWYVGDYRYFLEKKVSLDAEASLAAGTQAGRTGAQDRPSPGQEPKAVAQEPGAGKPLSYEEEKARKAKARKLLRREEEILARLEAIGSQKSSCETEMGLPANYSDGVRMRRLQAALEELEKEAENLNTEWEAIASELAAE